MRFKKIEFNNYRCFINGEMELEEAGEKNINLIIGPNGGGKTELLFAFWWTLYDFDFSNLRGKENTPYALNSDLYKELELCNPGEEKACAVVLEFEHLNVRYRVKKKAIYRKTEKQIRQEVYQEFSYYKQNGELSLPERDTREIDKKVNKIIPKAILDGIIFDGERMQKLSSADEKSKKAIKGVINDITNVELIESCIGNYKDIRKELNNAIKRLAIHNKQSNLEEIVKHIGANDNLIETNKLLVTQKRERLDEVENRISMISDELKEISGARMLEIQREEERKKVEVDNKQLDEYYKNFSACLKDAYLFNSTELLDDVEEIIQKIDVPVGLTVEAVRSILDRPKCICGKDIDGIAIEKLNELILSLPPDNINSTLAEVIRQTRDKIKDAKQICRVTYGYITTKEKELKASKERIASLSSQILGFDEEEARKLETENIELNNERMQLEFDIQRLKNETEQASKEREDLIEQRDNIGKSNEETNRLNKQLEYVEKCLKAFDLIKENNKEKALTLINARLEDAYERLSEDALLGNGIYIVQYDENYKYQMVVYIRKKAQAHLEMWRKNGEYARMIADGLNELQITEKAILANADSNSTGQSKMNTLAFVKAILDYSNEQKDENGLEIQKEYPFLIDAPFSDIAGGNLINASNELHNFSGQILLMLDRDKYNSVKPYLVTYVNKIYSLVKSSEKNITSIELEVI